MKIVAHRLVCIFVGLLYYIYNIYMYILYIYIITMFTSANPFMLAHNHKHHPQTSPINIHKAYDNYDIAHA